MSSSGLLQRLAGLRAQFIEGLPARAHEIDAWLQGDERPPEVLGRLAHRLRGVAGSHGFHALGELAAHVEEQCKAPRGPSLELDARQLHDALLRAHADAAVVPSDTAHAPPKKPLTGFRVVAIDDDASMRRLLELTLIELGGATAHVVSCSDDFWAELERGAADLVISDLMMPLEGGPALLSRASAAGLLGPAKIVVLSAAGPSEAQAERHGTVDPSWVWMSKPFRPPELVQALARLLTER